MVKVDVEEYQWRRGSIGEVRCCCGQKVSDLGIYLFSATNKTKWALVYSPETWCLHLQIALQAVQRNWICRLGRYYCYTEPSSCQFY